MIPTVEITPEIPSATPNCTLPPREEVSEEGFGSFRGTWFIGRVPLAEAEEIVREETEILNWLDRNAASPDDFEVLARAIETQETADVAADLGREVPVGLDLLATDGGDVFPLNGLEVGVSGLCHTLSAVGCLTAASCRSHLKQRSWSNVPVVFFRAPTWRVERLMELIAAGRCGLGEDRGMLTIHAASVTDLHRLAERLLAERGRFRRMPDHLRPVRASQVGAEQLGFELGRP